MQININKICFYNLVKLLDISSIYAYSHKMNNKEEIYMFLI